MEKRKDFWLINCIATSMLAYFCTIPFHESLHALTYLAYGDKVSNITAGSAERVGLVDFTQLGTFHKIMTSGSASIINAIIGVVLLVVLLKVTDIPGMLRLFLTQLMVGQLLEGFGYFLIGTFSIGDWGNVYKLFSDSPGTVSVLRIVLMILGFGAMVPILYIITYITYHFIETPSDKNERKKVSIGLNLVLFLAAYIVGALATINLPVVKSGEMSYWMFLLFNLMWFVGLVAFFYAWGGIMVKPPKQSIRKCSLPKEPHPIIWGLAVALILFDIFVLGSGIQFN
jgi:hypothetical protein